MLAPSQDTEPKMKDFCLAIMGPGGTGKTTVLKLVEALTIFFAGPETVRKLAPLTRQLVCWGETLYIHCAPCLLEGRACRQRRGAWRTTRCSDYEGDGAQV